MQTLRLLFETLEAAQAVAFMLQCEYDGCTMVALPPMHDTVALRTAIDLTGADFCFDGDYCSLGLPLVSHELISLGDRQLPAALNRKAELWCDEPQF